MNFNNIKVDENFKLICYDKTARKFSFTTYMAYLQHLAIAVRLTIQGFRLTNQGLNIDLQCVLYNKHNENLQHLFLDCEFSSYLWDSLLMKLDL